MTEAQLQDAVIELAKWRGWLVHHCRPGYSKDGNRVYTAIQGDRGFPDLVLARHDGRLIFAELKSAGGKMTDHQEQWQLRLQAAETHSNRLPDFGGDKRYQVEFHVWRPNDWLSGGIEEALT